MTRKRLHIFLCPCPSHCLHSPCCGQTMELTLFHFRGFQSLLRRLEFVRRGLMDNPQDLSSLKENQQELAFPWTHFIWNGFNTFITRVSAAYFKHSSEPEIRSCLPYGAGTFTWSHFLHCAGLPGVDWRITNKTDTLPLHLPVPMLVFLVHWLRKHERQCCQERRWDSGLRDNSWGIFSLLGFSGIKST